LAFSIFMVEILCPHCEGEIYLDDDASGEFECPLCNGEFEWNVEKDEKLRIAKEAHQKMVDEAIRITNAERLAEQAKIDAEVEEARKVAEQERLAEQAKIDAEIEKVRMMSEREAAQKLADEKAKLAEEEAALAAKEAEEAANSKEIPDLPPFDQ